MIPPIFIFVYPTPKPIIKPINYGIIITRTFTVTHNSSPSVRHFILMGVNKTHYAFRSCMRTDHWYNGTTLAIVLLSSGIYRAAWESTPLLLGILSLKATVVFFDGLTSWLLTQEAVRRTCYTNRKTGKHKKAYINSFCKNCCMQTGSSSINANYII